MIRNRLVRTAAILSVTTRSKGQESVTRRRGHVSVSSVCFLWLYLAESTVLNYISGIYIDLR